MENKIKNHIYLILIFLAAISVVGYGQDDASIVADSMDMCNSRNSVFLDGETITYKLYYNLNFIWIPAGEVTFTVDETDDFYFVQALGVTYPSYEWFFKVRDVYQAKIDKNTMLPVASLRDVHEGNYTKYENVHFDQVEGSAISELGNSKDNTELMDIDIGGCIHDLLSILYYVRNINTDQLKKNDEFPVRVYLSRKIYNLGVKFLGKQKKKKIKGLGNFQTMKFQPQVIDGNVFKKGTEMKVWVSDDKNRLPLMIESPVTIGSVKVVLKEFSGLKYDLSSKR